MSDAKSLYILGTRGVPAQHGGFETFAERFALYMVEQGWKVTVYCQVDDGPAGAVEDEWRGVRRVTFAAGAGAVGTMKFDWECVQHAMREKGVMLVLGYNTAVFSALLRLRGHPVITNMDGIEWKRAKWPWHGRIWLYINEWVGALTSTKLVADHPEIAKHLARRRKASDIVMIPYGADVVSSAPAELIEPYGVEPGQYLISIGRIEPENNILPMIRGYAQRPRNLAFVCLGKLEPHTNPYHAAVIAAGRGRVIFPGAIYDQATVKALRYHAAAYCHGHSVGGTNPSLVEAMGAGNPIIAHANTYNTWVVGESQFFFKNQDDCNALFNQFEASVGIFDVARRAIRARFMDQFQWPPILESYRHLIESARSRSWATKN